MVEHLDHANHATLEATMQFIHDREWLPLLADTEQPDVVQRQCLLAILSTQRGTQFGRKHGFASIRSYEEFVQAVPMLEYEELRQDIEDEEQSKEPILNAERPVHYVQTSGTTGKPKYLPLTRSTLEWIKRYQRLFAYAQKGGSWLWSSRWSKGIYVEGRHTVPCQG